MPCERFVDAYLAALLAQARKLISEEFHTVVRAAGLPVPNGCPGMLDEFAQVAGRHCA